MEELLKRYREMFDENFPLFEVMGSEKEVADIIAECLRTKKPYESKIEEDTQY